MSKERQMSITVPSNIQKVSSYSALSGEFTNGDTIFLFSTSGESPISANAEPQSKPGLQPASPEAIKNLREREQIQTLRENYGEEWKAHYPITKPQPTQAPNYQDTQNRGVIIDTQKQPTQVQGEMPAATPVPQEAIPTSTSQEVIIPDGRIVPFADDFVVGAVFLLD